MLDAIRRLRRRIVLNRSLPRVVRSVRADGLTYLDAAALNDLFQQVSEAEAEQREGILIEAGCALGGSAIVIAAAKSPLRPFYVYDAFGMIPPPSEHDGADAHERYQAIRSGESEGIRGGRYYGYQENLLEKVAASFDKYALPLEANNIHLVKGFFEDTLSVNEPVAFAHLDGDWYESVMTCLRRIEPHLVRGGVLVIDDYDDWSGCRKAADEYFGDKRGEYEFVRRARLQIIRR